jgi:hypothetical protein
VRHTFTLRLAAVGSLPKLEPSLRSGYTMLLHGLVFRPLVEPDKSGDWKSDVVEQWQAETTQRARFQLRHGLRFGDGTNVTVEDVVSAAESAGLHASVRDGWVTITPQHPETVLDALAPQALVSRRSGEDSYGTGLFRIESQDAGKIHLRRIDPTPGRISDVELLSFPTLRDAFAAFLRGEVNALATADPGQVELLEGVSRITIVGAPALHGVAALFNARRLPRDPRKALAAWLPVRQLATVYGEGCEPEVKQQLSMPAPEGEALEVVVADDVPGLSRVSLALQRALGPRAIVHAEPILVASAREAEGRFDVMVTPLEVWPPRLELANWATGAPHNWAGYSNPKVDQALRDGDLTRAERELEADPPFALICRPQRTLVIDSRVKNPQVGPYDLLETLPDWEVSP